MDAAKLYQLVEDPSLLNSETLPELKQMVDHYPWFQTVRVLYLKNLAVEKDVNFGLELKRMAIHISDRKKLFSFIEGEKFGLEIMKDAVEEVKNSFDLIDNFLSSQQETSGEGTPAETNVLLTTSPLASDYLHWKIDEKTEKQQEDEPTPRLHHQDLIDSFIEEDERRAPGSGIRFDEGWEDVFPEEVSMHEGSLKSSDDDSYFTETLARIYIKQRRYDKALQIIKSLSLKYPEKNVYFADQIRFLEKLIINNKK